MGKLLGYIAKLVFLRVGESLLNELLEINMSAIDSSMQLIGSICVAVYNYSTLKLAAVDNIEAKFVTFHSLL